MGSYLCVLKREGCAVVRHRGGLAERTGRPWRLPGELEWEASSGVDGRFHPWGDRLDPSWCRVRPSWEGRVRVEMSTRDRVPDIPWLVIV